MDFQKGLYRNTDPLSQPPGTYPYGKNGVLMEKLGAVINEPGLLTGAVIPDTLVGVIPTDRNPVLVVLSAAHKLELYYLDKVTLATTLILDTATLTNAPVFSEDDYFTGEAERNHKAEVVIAITNKTSRPLYINCDAPVYEDFSDLYLVPQIVSPSGVVGLIGGGSLPKGQYIPFVSYEKRDGTKTHFMIAGNGVTVGSQLDAKLSVQIDNLDQRFDLVTLGILHRSQGVTKAYKMYPIPVAGTSTTLYYGGTEVVIDILAEELLVIPPDYTKVGCMGQLNGELYLGDLEVDEEINYQKYALNVQVKVKSKLIDLVDLPPSHLSGAERSLLPQEVYALYIRLWTVAGRPTRWFHIPGQAPAAGEDDLATVGNMTDRVFKLQDTIHASDFAAKTCTPGVWLNDTETYPDTTDFDASGVGGSNLRLNRVRHHRMPSLKWLKENFYGADASYGRTKLDLLGLQVENVVIPAELEGKVSHYEIGYALRSVGSSTIAGYSPLQYGSRKLDDAGGDDNSLIYSTGGNWQERINPIIPYLTENKKVFRLHPFEGLFFRPQIQLSGLAPQFKLAVNTQLWEDGRGDGTSWVAEVVGVDYSVAGEFSTAGLTPMKVNNNQYVECDRVSGRYINLMVETSIVGELAAAGPSLLRTGYIYRDGDGFGVGPEIEETLLVALLMNRTDIYNSFYLQQVVPCALKTPVGTASAPVFAGDSFCALYTFHTYGDGVYTGSNPEFQGVRVVRRIAVPSAANINQRYETSSIYSKWWPKTALVDNDVNNYITNFSRREDPNQFGYDKDLNSVFDLDSGSVYNNLSNLDYKFPYRVHRFGKMGTDKRKSWRNVLPLDYYELRRDLGRLVNIDGDENLILHMEHALLITRDKAKLAGGPLSVTIGTGDIFQFEPKEGLSSPHGYAGTQHDLACLRCPLGYLFVDAEAGAVFLLKGELKELSGGISNMLRDILKTVSGKNPLRGAGITMGYDPKYKRVLLTVKGAQSFTISYSLLNDNWCFFHDYVPDSYVYTRDQLLSVKAGKPYAHNKGPVGKYDGAVRPFFIDLAIPFGGKATLDDIEWLTTGQNFTHITVWNQTQCTGRLPLVEGTVLTGGNMRKTKGCYVIDKLRDCTITDDFLNDLFSDFTVKENAVDPTLPFYQKSLIEDNFVIVRLECDNTQDREIALYDVALNIVKSTR